MLNTYRIFWKMFTHKKCNVFCMCSRCSYHAYLFIKKWSFDVFDLVSHFLRTFFCLSRNNLNKIIYSTGVKKVHLEIKLEVLGKYVSNMQYPSKHKTFVYHLYNVGPTSKTLGRRCTNVIQLFCAYWDTIAHINPLTGKIVWFFLHFKQALFLTLVHRLRCCTNVKPTLI